MFFKKKKKKEKASLVAAQTDSVALVMSGFKASCDLASVPRLCSFHPFLESQGPESSKSQEWLQGHLGDGCAVRGDR